MSVRSHRPDDARGGSLKYLIAGGAMLALVGVMADLRGTISMQALRPARPANVCEEIVQPQASLSREELSRLLTIPERSPKESVRAIVQEPYCRMGAVEVRAGAPAEREAYPLEFDPQTWFVVLYEGEEYVGYSFVFNR